MSADQPEKLEAENAAGPAPAPSLAPGCGIWLSWVAASIFGMLLGWALGWRVSFMLPGLLASAGIGLLTGAGLGSLQALVLRRSLAQPGWWLAATAAGWTAGFGVGTAAAAELGLTEFQFGLLAGAITGAAAGLLQWLVLRRMVTQAGWWIPASIFAWSSSLLYFNPGVSWLGAFYGLLSGMVTGTLLLWLLYRPSAE